MAIPAELAFEEVNSKSREDVFRDQFISPLLQRLGFFLISDNHHTREFGKDIIFADIDRFGHVRYHAVQAKHKDCVSKNDVREIIDQCKDAFRMPFLHPQSGAKEYIGTYYAMNAGSFSPEAREYYFETLKPQYGDNVRLLDGQTLVALDMSSSASQLEILPVLNGLRLEIRYNINLSQRLISECAAHQTGNSYTLKLCQFRLKALEAYLMRPIAIPGLSIDEVEGVLEQMTILNSAMASPAGIVVVTAIDNIYSMVRRSAPQILSECQTLTSLIENCIKTLKPLTAP